MMRRTNGLRLSTAALAAALAVAGGCKTENTYERDKPTYEANVININKVETDPFLKDKAHVLEVRQADANGLLKVDVELVSDRLWSGSFDYKFEWFDDQGMPVDSPMSSWTTRQVQPQERFSIDAIAPTPKCKDFRLKLQRSIRG
ncbi:MAG TPA: YcfL family protein [Tepidisphaeraceae bacterium]|nr:YcfL family protein [Tepidisphaeraceae bacterium]